MKNILTTFLLCICCTWLSAKQVSPDLNGGVYTRNGNTVTYKWVHPANDGREIEVNFSIDFRRGWYSMQETYKRQKHQHGDYNRFVDRDPYKNDLYFLANQLAKIALHHGVSKALLALSFVQALPYQKEMGSYQRYAVETLIDARGDCSDTSVLLAGIYAAWGYGYVFLHFPGHLAVGVWSDPIQGGTYFQFSGKEYYYCETTGTGWDMGKAPDKYRVCDRMWYACLSNDSSRISGGGSSRERPEPDPTCRRC